MSETIRTPIVDKNGKATTVHKKVDAGKPNRTRGLGVPTVAKPKDAPGLFIGRPSLGAAWNPEAYIDRSYPEFSEVTEPSNRVETIKALSDSSGKKAGGSVRWVELNYVNTDTTRLRNAPGLIKYELPLKDRNDTFNIIPPKDGTPMIVRNTSGFTQLNIESGNAVIALNSASGNPLRIAGDANVVVILAPNAKCSIEVEGEATVQIVPQVGSRGWVTPKENAQVEIMDYAVGEDQHSFTDTSIPIDYDAIAKAKAEEKESTEDALQAWMNGKKS